MLGAILAIGYTALFLYAILRMRFFALPGLRKRHLAGLFLLKVMAGTALWWIYTYHFADRSTADIYKYFDSSKPMYDALWTKPVDFFQMLFGIRNDSPYFSETYYRHMDHWFRKYESNLYNDSHTMIRFNALVRIFSDGHFHVHTVFAAFLSFVGMTALCRAFVQALRGRERVLYAAVFLLPSVLFWASGVIKESLLFFGFGLFVWLAFRIMQKRPRLIDMALMLFCTMLLFLLKFYVLLSAIPALIALAWCRRSAGTVWIKYAVVLTAYLAIGLNIHHVIDGFNVLDILHWKQRDFIGLATLMHSGSFAMPEPLEPTLWSFLKQAPYALFMTLAGPIIYPGGGALGILAAMENIAILLIVVLCIVYRREIARIDLPLLLCCITFFTLLALVIGYTTPVMGAVVRYRTPLLPFVLIAAILIIDERRISTPFPKLKNLFP